METGVPDTLLSFGKRQKAHAEASENVPPSASDVSSKRGSNLKVQRART